MDGKIARIHWARVPPEHAPFEPGQPCWAIWPEPVDHDVCFEAAGFHGFADTDAQWDAEWTSMIDTLFTCLSQAGEPVLLSGTPPTIKQGWWKRRRGTIRETLEWATDTDSVPLCCVGFGEPPGAKIVAANGHPLFWIYLNQGIPFEQVMADISGPREIVNTELRWHHLAPLVDE